MDRHAFRIAGRGLRARRRWGAFAVALLSLAQLGGACDDESPVRCPTYALSTLEGYVRAGGAGVAARITARVYDRPSDSRFGTESDSSGWYHLDLVPGTYRLWVETLDGRSASPSSRDSISIGPGTRHEDLLFGRVTVRVEVPAFLDGHEFECELVPMTPRARSSWVYAHPVDGRLVFEIPLAAPGVYCFRVEVDNAAQIYLPAADNPYAAQQVVVGLGSPRVYEASFAQAMAVSGTVRGSWQQAGLSSLHIEAVSPNGAALSRGSTLADGSFTLSLLLPEPFRLRIEGSGIEQWAGGDSSATATLFEPQPGEHITGIEVIESGILCTLVGPEFVVPRGALVRLRDATGHTYQFDSSGSNTFAICNLRPGRYFLSVSSTCQNHPQSWAAQWYDGADSLARATPIDLPAGALVPITVQLGPGGGIVARLRNADGTPSDDAPLALYDRQGKALCDSWRHQYADSLWFGGLADGDYKLAAGLSWTQSWWYPGTTDVEAAGVISIRDHATVRGIEWRLPAAGFAEMHP